MIETLDEQVTDVLSLPLGSIYFEPSVDFEALGFNGSIKKHLFDINNFKTGFRHGG